MKKLAAVAVLLITTAACSPGSANSPTAVPSVPKSVSTTVTAPSTVPTAVPSVSSTLTAQQKQLLKDLNLTEGSQQANDELNKASAFCSTMASKKDDPQAIAKFAMEEAKSGKHPREYIKDTCPELSAALPYIK